MKDNIVPIRRPAGILVEDTPENCAAKCFRDKSADWGIPEQQIDEMRSAFNCYEHGIIAWIASELPHPHSEEGITEEWDRYWRGVYELAQSRVLIREMAVALDAASKALLLAQSSDTAIQHQLTRCAASAKHCSDIAVAHLGRNQ